MVGVHRPDPNRAQRAVLGQVHAVGRRPVGVVVARAVQHAVQRVQQQLVAALVGARAGLAFGLVQAHEQVGVQGLAAGGRPLGEVKGQDVGRALDAQVAHVGGGDCRIVDDRDAQLAGEPQMVQQRVQAIEQRDPTTSGHSLRVSVLSTRLAKVVDRADARELDHVEGHLSYEDVSFAYDPAEAERFVLPHFSLDVPAGQTLAVVGPTGHGKSTMVQLLARFYDVQHGAVKVDGVDLREVSQHSLRRHIGVVLQDNVLFSGSILDNLRLARPEAEDGELIAACRELGADHVLERLPQGYATGVGPEGKNLSHGCRQLVCLVRAFLADPAVLVLDEATSAVDLYTERRIQRALRRLTAGRTAIVIAHRLATIRDADRIIMIRDGTIVEDGDHETLLERGGPYAELHAAYLRGEEAA